ncbi:MAG: ATP-binding cassette domain-containing protein [Bacteroidales bacterium]|nr:ATP-binding cassette domain-containing protein [Candidatus Cryptobacteroides aphodequi]
MDNSSSPIISFRKADIAGGDAIVVYGLDMEILVGEFVYIVGKVGTGKTSIIRTLIAESLPVNGSCRCCGYDIGTIRSRDIPMLRRRIGVVFQDFQLLMDRDVHDNLAFVLEATGWEDPILIERRIEEVLQAVGMTTKEHRMPHQLSGGEQQRIAIARAILNSPRLIIADEPTGNLDPETADGIMKLLKKINSEGTAIVMVTHSRDFFARYPGRIFLCENEKCRELAEAPAKGL